MCIHVSLQRYKAELSFIPVEKNVCPLPIIQVFSFQSNFISGAVKCGGAARHKARLTMVAGKLRGKTVPTRLEYLGVIKNLVAQTRSRTKADLDAARARAGRGHCRGRRTVISACVRVRACVCLLVMQCSARHNAVIGASSASSSRSQLALDVSADFFPAPATAAVRRRCSDNPVSRVRFHATAAAAANQVSHIR
ncbi:hypothetical protein J6590_042093 [Homalodisca vitripennis]|nr:hypothetical protein J6590_088048 [Homalodisca vitripennis]KAG8336576.1 hypothetical protein J6590_042093 [Homalodisca vitripennis]